MNLMILEILLLKNHFLKNSMGSTRKIKYSKEKLSEIKTFFSKDLRNVEAYPYVRLFRN